MRSGTTMAAVLAAIVATTGASSAVAEEETSVETSTASSAEMEAMRVRLVQASEAACSHAFTCAMAGVPESVRGMIDRNQICQVYNRYERISADEYDRQCAEAALAYFACIENTSCEAFTNTRGAEFCGAEGEEARKQCDSD